MYLLLIPVAAHPWTKGDPLYTTPREIHGLYTLALCKPTLKVFVDYGSPKSSTCSKNKRCSSEKERTCKAKHTTPLLTCIDDHSNRLGMSLHMHQIETNFLSAAGNKQGGKECSQCRKRNFRYSLLRRSFQSKKPSSSKDHDPL